MWGHGLGRQTRERAMEEAVKQETRRGPPGTPGPRRPSVGGASALGFTAVLVLFFLVGDCSQEPAEPAPSATPTPVPSAAVIVAIRH